MMFVRAIVAALATSMLWTAAATASAQSVGRELTRADLEGWLDGFLPFALDQGDVAGAVVVAVKDGEVLLQKGYGYADVQRAAPVDAERTLFRPGSISKLFTYTAVMQLVEQRKLALDRDINDYLDFEIPPAFGKPITLRNLLTHTPGFEDVIKGIYNADAARLPLLDAYVKSMLPARIFPPGEVPAYSNYGTALCGYIVQRVSGKDFADYIEQHILQPLGMLRSTFRQPLPNALAADMATGYRLASGAPGVFELIAPAPAGSLTATGADVARFMIAHLQMARGVQGGLLRPETARLMHAPAMKALAPLNGFTLGFFESDRNGRRIIGHGGDTEFFHSDLNLLLDEDVGLFFSINSAGAGDADLNIRMALFAEFMDRYFPAGAAAEPTTSTALEHARRVAEAGPYELSLRNQSSFRMFAGLLGQMRAEVNDDATLVIPAMTGLNGRPKIWREVSPYVWRQVDGAERLAARVVDGQVRALGFEPYASVAILQPVPGWRSASWNLPVLAGAVVVLLASAISWPAGLLIRRRHGGALLGEPALTALRWSRLVVLAHLAFVIGWAMVVAAGDLDWSGSQDAWMRLLQFVGCIALVGTGTVMWSASLTCSSTAIRWPRKVWSVLLVAACLSVAWFAIMFRLITVPLIY